MNVIFFKGKMQSIVRSCFFNFPLCTNCVYFSSKNGSFYCDKFKTFTIISRLDEKKCGITGNYFKFKGNQK